MSLRWNYYGKLLWFKTFTFHQWKLKVFGISFYWRRAIHNFSILEKCSAFTHIILHITKIKDYQKNQVFDPPVLLTVTVFYLQLSPEFNKFVGVKLVSETRGSGFRWVLLDTLHEVLKDSSQYFSIPLFYWLLMIVDWR